MGAPNASPAVGHGECGVDFAKGVPTDPPGCGLTEPDSHSSGQSQRGTQGDDFLCRCRIVTARLTLRCWQPRDARLLKAAIESSKCARIHGRELWSAYRSAGSGDRSLEVGEICWIPRRLFAPDRVRFFEVGQSLIRTAVAAQHIAEKEESTGELRTVGGERRAEDVDAGAECRKGPAQVVQGQTTAAQVVPTLGDVAMTVAESLAPRGQGAFVETQGLFGFALLLQQPRKQAQRLREAGI